MSTSLFNRTVRTNIVLYRSKGEGRDSYIIHNNGGFWKEETSPINTREIFYHKPINIFHSTNKIPPICSYHSDGSGRDKYVSINNGGLSKNYNCMKNYFKNILRKKDETKTDEKICIFKLSRDERLYLKKINKIQKDLVNRLYNNIKKHKGNIRNKILNKDKIQIDGNLTKNSFNYDSNLENRNKSLFQSSSQIFQNRHLEPIKNYKNNFENLKISPSNSLKDIFRKRISFKNNINRNNSFFKSKYIFNVSDSIKYPNVKCSLDER